MLVPNLRRIFTQDFAAEYKDFVAALSSSLNINLEVLYNALNRNITLGQNIACTIKDIDITVNAQGVPTSTVAFERANQLPIEGVTVLNVINLDNPTVYPTSQPYVAWTINQTGRVQVQYVSSLVANNKYRLKIVVWN